MQSLFKEIATNINESKYLEILIDIINILIIQDDSNI